MIMRSWFVQASSARRVTPESSCSGCSRGIRTWKWSSPPPTATPGEWPPICIRHSPLAYPGLTFDSFDISRIVDATLDVVFLGLPHQASMALVPQLVGSVGCIVDLSAAFRLKDASLYPTWYGFDHDQPELLERSGVRPARAHRKDLPGARLVATPGCYVTAATLALAPLLDAGLIERAGIIVDAASGVSGAGRVPTATNVFGTVDENFTAYGLLDHRHTPEIEQNLDAQVLFTPHLAPMNRGILATCYSRPAAGIAVSTESLLADLASTYADEPFVVVTHASAVDEGIARSNTAFVSARYDERHGYGHRSLSGRTQRPCPLWSIVDGWALHHWLGALQVSKASRATSTGGDRSPCSACLRSRHLASEARPTARVGHRAICGSMPVGTPSSAVACRSMVNRYVSVTSTARGGFQGRGCAAVLQPHACPPCLLEALLFGWVPATCGSCPHRCSVLLVMRFCATPRLRLDKKGRCSWPCPPGDSRDIRGLLRGLLRELLEGPALGRLS